MIKFTQLTDKLPYPPKFKARLATLHADIITYTIDHFQNTSKFKAQVVGVLNTISYFIISGDSLPANWSPNQPFINIDPIENHLLEETLKDMLISVRTIQWDIEVVDTAESVYISKHIPPPTKTPPIPLVMSTNSIFNTPKEHLYIKPPTIPQFDKNKPWLNMVKDGVTYTIYHSLPIVPLNQSQISVTTDVSSMTASDLLKLYPNCFIRTRSASMYESHEGVTLDPVLGAILHIDGFSEQQVRDNIIRYPHIYKLMRYVNDDYISFYSHIEIDGVLYDTLEVWDNLPDSKYIPRNSEFIKEYVVRRYLLERDIKGIQHKYPLFGTLEPFLTLFTTPADYKEFGYDDYVELARQCVKSRVSYKQSRNPILRVVYNS